MDFDVLIIGGGVAGMSCALVLGSAQFKPYAKDKKIGILITDHNVQETLAITDRTYLMFEGSILKHGIPTELAADEMVRKVYLGRNFELRKKKLEL